ncbi:MAG: hypothetical protein LUE08_08355, partial [Akkermansiaceae bacterium]|nr:hypothetical protein [Akkermansiaceae bacterium]
PLPPPVGAVDGGGRRGGARGALRRFAGYSIGRLEEQKKNNPEKVISTIIIYLKSSGHEKKIIRNRIGSIIHRLGLYGYEMDKRAGL